MCMQGITRSNVMALCRSNGIPLRETDFSLTQVRAVALGGDHWKEPLEEQTLQGSAVVPTALRQRKAVGEGDWKGLCSVARRSDEARHA